MVVALPKIMSTSHKIGCYYRTVSAAVQTAQQVIAHSMDEAKLFSVRRRCQRFRIIRKTRIAAAPKHGVRFPSSRMAVREARTIKTLPAVKNDANIQEREITQC